jgi:hypothetical protein
MLPWTHTNNPGSPLDAALAPAAISFQAVSPLEATVPLETTTPIKIPLPQLKPSLPEAVVVHETAFLHLRLRQTR